MDQFGFVLCNSTIKYTFGFRYQTSLGNILNRYTGDVDLTTTISVGIGYTSKPFGVGYNYTFINKKLGVHTPILMINALNNNLRIAIPIQIAVSDNPFNGDALFDGNLAPAGDILVNEKEYLGISTDI